MSNEFLTISKIIHSRRSTKPVKMNGKKIPDQLMKQILELANWAPTHGRTEPWRFIVYSKEKLTQFCLDHAELYKKFTPPENFQQATYDKQLHNGDLASHGVIAIMKSGDNPKIPALEEIAATAASIENILLGAAASGLAAFWSTGGMIHKQPMKDFLKLRDQDVIMGLIYFGYTDDQATGNRASSIDEKIDWK
jgi:nitroreductase